MTQAGAQVCVEYTGSGDFEAACTAGGGNYSSSQSCPSGVGYCSVTSGSMTEAMHFYPPLTANLASQACTARGGSWNPGSPTAVDGGRSGDGGYVPGVQPDVCAHYVSCVMATTPGGAAATLAAYGPAGTCWQTTAAIAADCTKACLLGLSSLRGRDVACGCKNDGECAGATPACNLSSGACVACNTDAQCVGKACSANHTCVECTTDANCKDPSRPHCNKQRNACVACTSGSQCPSGACTSANTCCVPEDRCKLLSYNCGYADDGCGRSITCGGTCAVGKCEANRCTTIGQDCEPGITKCATAEYCMVDAWHQAYKCAVPAAASSCYTGADCQATYVNGQPIEPYQCVGGKCWQNCVKSSDCLSGTCKATLFGIPISLKYPGACM